MGSRGKRKRTIETKRRKRLISAAVIAGKKIFQNNNNKKCLQDSCAIFFSLTKMDKHGKAEGRIGLAKEISEVRGQAPGIGFKKKKKVKGEEFSVLFFHVLYMCRLL